MAQLNAPASDIQLKSGMLTTAKLNALTTAAEKEAAWTDGTYPSAKAVVDKLNATVPDKFEHPVNSIIITSTNTNPGATLGGEWELIDKEFETSTSVIGGPEIPFSPTANGFRLSGETIVRSGHHITLKLIASSSDGSDKSVPSGQTLLTIANLTLDRYGVHKLTYDIRNGIAFATNSTSNTSSSAVSYWILDDGEFALSDVLNGGSNTHTLNKSAAIYINVTLPILYTDMIDSFCDKFYWKRTK